MITITRNFKSFQFSSWSIGLWVIGTIVGAIAFYFLTEWYLGFWIQGGMTCAVVGILQTLGVPIQVELSEGSIWHFAGCRYSATMAYGCTGFQIVAICVAFLVFHPHPLNAAERQGIWVRKIKAILASVGIMQGVNFLRLLVEMSQLYNWAHYHIYVAIVEACLTLPVLMWTRRWLPELGFPTIIDHKLDDLEVFQNLGITTIEQFARENPVELAVLLGVSAGIVKKWMLRAKHALESAGNSDVDIDLYDICLWYSRVKSRRFRGQESPRSEDFNLMTEQEHDSITQTSERPAVSEYKLFVPSVKMLDTIQGSPPLP